MGRGEGFYDYHILNYLIYIYIIYFIFRNICVVNYKKFKYTYYIYLFINYDDYLKGNLNTKLIIQGTSRNSLLMLTCVIQVTFSIDQYGNLNLKES